MTRSHVNCFTLSIDASCSKWTRRKKCYGLYGSVYGMQRCRRMVGMRNDGRGCGVAERYAGRRWTRGGREEMGKYGLMVDVEKRCRVSCYGRTMESVYICASENCVSPCRSLRMGSLCGAVKTEGGAGWNGVVAGGGLWGQVGKNASRQGHGRCRGMSRNDRPVETTATKVLEVDDVEAVEDDNGGMEKRIAWLREIMSTAPRVRLRKAEDRARDQLADLAVLNEKLALEDEAEASAARRRIDFIRRKRATWEMIHDYVTRKDAIFTLSAIEDANRKVEHALSENSRERIGVGNLKKQLELLQQEVAAAHSKLHLTQARVDANLKRIEELKQEAERLTRIQSTKSSSYESEQRAVESTVDVRSTADEILLKASNEENLVSPNDVSEEHLNNTKALESSLILEDGLRNHWFAVQFSSKLDENTLIPFDLFGEPWVLFRDKNGIPACIKDECAHRGCPLSLGSKSNGEVQCPYHGWRFDNTGACTDMPSTVFCKGISVSSLPVVERHGFIFVWPGWRECSPPPSEDIIAPPKGYTVHAEIEVEVPVDHGLLLENLLDLAHAPFTHTSTFAKGWPIPDMVRVQTAQVLSGSWQPYPIDMSFEPPCMVFSTIGLKQPGKIERGSTAADCRNHLHQMHVCLPSKPGHTRLLYRMSMDFLEWTRYIPGIHKFWERIAGQVLGEDLLLVQGQQDRLLRGGKTFAHPVAYDQLGVRYRRWRTSQGK